jgi:glycosyltransferase involved in cell wall biosynthesis/spore maturation protein CgeB/ubiquinone/menaquinone biosynthesis C-methylase UbiE
MSNPESQNKPEIGDRVTEAYYGGMGEAFKRKTHARIQWICEQTKGSNILDVGCSQGIVPILLARERKVVVGIDIDPIAIEYARKQLEIESKFVQENVSFINEDFISCKLQHKKFDTILLTEVLEHLSKPKAFIDKSKTLLKPNGSLVITVPFGINDYIDHKQTFYYTGIHKLIDKEFHIKNIQYLGQWIGITAKCRNPKSSRIVSNRLTLKSVSDLENAFYNIERELRDNYNSANSNYSKSTDQIKTLKAWIDAANSKIQESQKQNDTLHADLKKLTERLNGVNEKHRLATEQIKTLKEWTETANAKAESSEELKSKFQVEVEKLTERLGGVNEKHRLASEQIKTLKEWTDAANAKAESSEEQKSKFQVEAEKLTERLNGVNEKHRLATEQIKTLKEWADAANAKAEASEEQKSKFQVEVEKLTERVNGVNEKHRLATEQIKMLKEWADAANAKAEASEEQKSKFQVEAEKLTERLNGVNEKHRLATEQIKLLKNSVRDLKEENKVMQNQSDEALLDIKNLKDTINSLNIKLHEANLKYRESTGYIIPKLKETIEQNNISIKRQITLNNELKTKLKQRVLELKESAFYQLGLALLDVKSIKKILFIPRKLYKIHRYVKKRRLARITINKEPKENKNIKELNTHNAGYKRVKNIPLLDSIIKNKEVRISCIMDEFTYHCFKPECRLDQLTPNKWKDELESHNPNLLFIESAWRGKDDLWGSKVGHLSQEIVDIVKWCNQRSVPTIFWNKEDPIHYPTFLNTARIFDYIFTTDVDCIQNYKNSLGHNNVYLLPFACQPELHNPIEKYERKDVFCFAGAYYKKYPDRAKDLENFTEKLPQIRPLEIFDRNYGKNDPNYQFPPFYNKFIQGTLPFEQIDKAYKGYKYAINLNSIKQSQTMFARRVLELLASNTIVVSNFSRGVRQIFGDLIFCSDSGSEIIRRLEEAGADPTKLDRIRLAALRKVMREHTYEHRLTYILDKLSGRDPSLESPLFNVFCRVGSEKELQSIIAHINRQIDVCVTTTVILDGSINKATAERLLEDNNIKSTIIAIDELAVRKVQELIQDTDWIAVMVAEDYYGCHYLLDLSLATKYSSSDAIGKATYHQLNSKEVTLVKPEFVYKSVTQLPIRASIVKPSTLLETSAQSFVEQFNNGCYDFENQFSTDPYNYCRLGAKSNSKHSDQTDSILHKVRQAVDDITIDTGLNALQLFEQSESIEPRKECLHDLTSFNSDELMEIFGHKGSRNIAQQIIDGELLICSQLDEGKHEYIYAKKEFTPKSLMPRGQSYQSTLQFYLDTEPGLNLSLVVLFLDAKKGRIGNAVLPANRNHTVAVPDKTKSIRLGWRVYSSGTGKVKCLVLGHRDLQVTQLIGKSDVLLLTNNYPSYDDLYRNGFVHSRIKAYQERGVDVDVFRLRKDTPTSWHEFQNVDVTTGSADALRRLLITGHYRHVLVHFLDADMWGVLREFIEQVKVTVWLHGSEIQPWWRRKFNYTTDEMLEEAKQITEVRLKFWRSLLNPMPENLQLVFVSNYLEREVAEDLGISFPESKFHIIHNPIDTDLFTYQEKDSELRKKILSIRPYASRVYANDLSVQAILKLSRKTFFNDLEFRMIGDGPLFEQTLEPLRGFDNVTIKKGFITQQKIAELYKQYGVFLCPSRSDTQGVSRDEAMASGLVPVTNGVAAIPEFFDDSCGILAPSEDAHALASGIERLYENPELFQSMSGKAAERVRKTLDKALILEQELSAFPR